MATKERSLILLPLLITMLLVFAACGPGAAPAEEAPPAEPEQAVEVPADEKMGGSITFTHLEPATLNPYIRPDLEAWAAAQMVTKGFVDLDPDGNWVPILATELPSLENGTVSPDGLVVTWKLHPDLKWSDGEPITVEDLVYTWEICSDPGSGCAWNAGFDKIESIASEDNVTVVITYKEFHPDFIGQFRNGILPKHGTGPGTNMLEWEWNRTVNPGNGPYMVDEWVPSDHITFVRNPYFYDAPKPYIDEVIWKIVPDFEVMRQMLISGDADALAFLGEPESIQEMKDLGFTIHGSNAFNNRLQLNPYDPNDLTQPHPILGDPDVRKAIFMAVDREAITYNWNIPGIFDTELFTSMFDMWPAFACDIEPFPSDDEGAMELLEAAGWKDTDGDGFRECDGCKYAAAGTPLKLRVSSYSGWGMEDNEVVIVDELKQVGIEGEIVNYEATVMYSSWADGSFMYRGDYDILWWDDSGVMPDPQQRAVAYYHSSQVPSEENPTGFNMSRIADPEIDAWLDAAGSTPDPKVRQENYCKVAEKVMKELILEQHNGAVPYVGVANARIQDWDANELYAPMGWDIANWWIKE